MSESTILPPEILLDIFQYINWKDLVRIERVCKLFVKIIRNNTFEDQIIELKKYQIAKCVQIHCFVSFHLSSEQCGSSSNLSNTGITDYHLKLILESLSKKELKIKKIIIDYCYYNWISDDCVKNLREKGTEIIKKGF